VEENKYKCYVYLAGESETNQLLSVFCKVAGFTKDEARENVARVLQKYKESHTYHINYLGMIDFHDLDKEVVEEQAELFDKYDSVWILNCSYSTAIIK